MESKNEEIQNDDSLDKAVEEIVKSYSDATKEEIVEKSMEGIKMNAKDDEKKVVKKEAKVADEKDAKVDEENDDEEQKKANGMKENKIDVKAEKSLTDEEYQEYIDLKKAATAAKEEAAQKEQFETIRKAVSESTDGKFSELGDLFKSFNEKISSLEEKVEKFAVAPARERKSFDKVQTIEKSFVAEEEKQEKLDKASTLNVLLDLCKAGKISEKEVTMFELTNELSDNAKQIIKKA